MLHTIPPEYYPYLPIILGLIFIVAALYIICYRYTDMTNSFMISFTAMIFLHLDLATYDATYPLFEKFLNFFILDQIHPLPSFLIQMTGLVILALPPFFVWFIPMVLMDEKLTGDICSKDLMIRIKSGIILCFGLVMNTLFVIAILNTHGNPIHF